jgi:hypothetical protein
VTGRDDRDPDRDYHPDPHRDRDPECDRDGDRNRAATDGTRPRLTTTQSSARASSMPFSCDRSPTRLATRAKPQLAAAGKPAAHSTARSGVVGTSSRTVRCGLY